MRRSRASFSRIWWWGRPDPDCEQNKAIKQQAWKRQLVITTPAELKAVEQTHRHLVRYRKTLGEGDERVQIDIEIQAIAFAAYSVEAKAVREIETIDKLIEAREKANLSAEDLVKRRWTAEAALAVYQADPPVLEPPLLNPPEPPILKQ